MGELQVPADALWGAQTQRAVENFPISGYRLPRAFIRALALIKQAAAAANARLGLLDAATAAAIGEAAAAGGGRRATMRSFRSTCSRPARAPARNMNANEVIAHLAARAGVPGAPERSRQHGPEQQRCDSDRDPRVGAR